MRAHWYDGKNFDNFEWNVYQFVLELGTKILKERLSPKEFSKANYCSLCLQRAIANLGKDDSRNKSG